MFLPLYPYMLRRDWWCGTIRCDDVCVGVWAISWHGDLADWGPVSLGDAVSWLWATGTELDPGGGPAPLTSLRFSDHTGLPDLSLVFLSPGHCGLMTAKLNGFCYCNCNVFPVILHYSTVNCLLYQWCYTNKLPFPYYCGLDSARAETNWNNSRLLTLKQRSLNV